MLLSEGINVLQTKKCILIELQSSPIQLQSSPIQLRSFPIQLESFL